MSDSVTTGDVKKKNRTVNLKTAVWIVTVVGVISFIIGTRSDNLPQVFGQGQNKQLSSNLDFTSVEGAYDVLRDKFDGKLDQQKLIDGAKKGLVEAAGDPYTTYFSEAEAKQFMDDLEGKFSGIGAELGKKDDKLIVVSTLDDTPARKSGLLQNDAIVKVNDQDATTWSIDKAVSEIRGEKGTTVKLTVLRGSEIKEFSIIRADIVNPSVRYEIVDNVGYLRISRFAENDTVSLAKQAANEFKNKGVKGVVVDLRGNGGGYLEAARDIAGIWLNDKIAVQERRGGKIVDTLRTGKSAVLEGVPTTVLVDGGSASASEILAGALKDNGAANLVGMKTFGKGSVQEIEHLPGGGQLKITIAKWYTPNGKNIDKEGIEPDVKVELNEADAAANRDPQKDRAFEEIKKR